MAWALLLALAACGNSSAGKDPSAKASAAGSSASASAPPAPSGAAEAALGKLDLQGLTARERTELTGQLAKLSAPCDEPVTLAACISESRACKACVPAGRYLGKLVRFGTPEAQRKAIYEARFDPKKLKSIDLGDSPSMGPEDAVVTIVEWADFECTGCLGMKPLFELMIERFPGQVRLVYKNFPLESKHPNAMGAAKAAVAGQNQGKFWEMHKALFESQGSLAPQDLSRIAKKVGLDMVKFRADFSSPATAKDIKRDMDQAEALGLDGTPFIFINGRQPPIELFEPFFENFEEWVRLEIELAGKEPAKASEKFGQMAKDLGLPLPGASGSAAAPSAAAPTGSASAAPAPSASAAPSAAPKP